MRKTLAECRVRNARISRFRRVLRNSDFRICCVFFFFCAQSENRFFVSLYDTYLHGRYTVQYVHPRIVGVLSSIEIIPIITMRAAATTDRVSRYDGPRIINLLFCRCTRRSTSTTTVLLLLLLFLYNTIAALRTFVNVCVHA